MSLPRSLHVLVLSAAAACADPSPEAEAFLAVPDAVWEWRLPSQDFKVADLPDALVKLAGPTLGIDGEAQTSFSGFALDLNGDKSSEYFLQSQLGGSGGPHFFIYGKSGGTWANIGDLQGGFHLLKPIEGWKPILGFSRGGGDSFAKYRLEFNGERYSEVWLAHFDAGQIIPPQGLIPHRAWCDDAPSLDERILRLEGFWNAHLPQCDGGAEENSGEYEDGPHISYIRGTAYALSLAYTEAGNKEGARKMIEWLRWSDQLDLWRDLPNPLTKVAPDAPEE